MSVVTKKDLMNHLGCAIHVVCYGDWKDPASVCVECLDCNEVLFDISDDKPNIEAEFEQYKKESVKWCVEDFTEYNKDDEDWDWTITEEQAQEALEDMIHHHDACIGITWDTIEFYYEKHGTHKTKENENS